jgi:hypothetical protein
MCESENGLVIPKEHKCIGSQAEFTQVKRGKTLPSNASKSMPLDEVAGSLFIQEQAEKY